MALWRRALIGQDNNGMKVYALRVKISASLSRALDGVCLRLGLSKRHVIESAIREKIEDLLDREDLRMAVRRAAGFHRWELVRKEAYRRI